MIYSVQRLVFIFYVFNNFLFCRYNARSHLVAGVQKHEEGRTANQMTMPRETVGEEEEGLRIILKTQKLKRSR